MPSDDVAAGGRRRAVGNSGEGQATGGGRLPLTASAVAELLGGTVVGDGSVQIFGAAPLDRAGERDVSLFTDARYAEAFGTSAAGVVLVSPALADAPGRPACRVVVPKPQEGLQRLLAALYPERAPEPGVHPTAVLGRGVRLGAGVAVGAFCVVGDAVSLGDRVRLGPHCVIEEGVSVGDDAVLVAAVTCYSGAVIGRRVRLHAGVRVASDGYGYVFRDGAHQKIPHVGRAIIEDDVEVGANSTIDRGSIDDTVVGAGTKIDNLVHVAHNVRIGRRCLIMAQVGLAGSARVGDGVILAGQSAVGDHRSVGDGATLAGKAGPYGDVPAGETWSGYPARPHREALRANVALSRLAGMIKQLEALVSGSEP